MPLKHAITADTASFQEYAKLSLDRLFSRGFSGTIAAPPKQKTDLISFNRTLPRMECSANQAGGDL
jgi:hypothetical protein